MLKMSLLATTLLFAFAGPALAQTTTQQSQMPTQQQGQRLSPFERADANNDGIITREEVRVVRTTAFTRLDANRDGFLVREEMPNPTNGRRGHSKKNGQGRTPLGQSDTNSDGNISRAEFDAASARNRATLEAQTEAWRNREFARFDANKDGTITVIETEAARSASQGQRPPREAQSRSKMSERHNPDTNNDQKVSLAEWLSRPDPLFEQGDANSDGRVTREEAATFMRQGREQRPLAKRPW